MPNKKISALTHVALADLLDAMIVDLVDTTEGSDSDKNKRTTLGVIKEWIAADRPLDKFDATTAPSVTDDSSEGYTYGSRWLDRTGLEEYT